MKTYTIQTVADVPYGTYPAYPTGPALVTNDDWNTALSTGRHIDGYMVRAFKVVSESPYASEYHPLDGQVFSSREDAHRAEYEAGLIAYMVYDQQN